jgi:hypothetical protein
VTAVSALLQWLWAPIVAALVSCIYFAQSTNSSFRERLAVSVHGALLALIFLVALMVGFFGLAHRSFAVPFWAALFFPAISALVALVRFQGVATVHWMQVPLLAAAAWIYFVGTMAITGEWL